MTVHCAVRYQLAVKAAHSAKGPAVLSSTRVCEAMASRLACGASASRARSERLVNSTKQRCTRVSDNAVHPFLLHPNTSQPPFFCPCRMPTSSCRSPTSSGTRSTASPYCCASRLRSACSRSRLQKGRAWQQQAECRQRRRQGGVAGSTIGALHRCDQQLLTAPAARQRPFHARWVVPREVFRHQRAGEARGTCEGLEELVKLAESPASCSAAALLGALCRHRRRRRPELCPSALQLALCALQDPNVPSSPHTTTSNWRGGGMAVGQAEAHGSPLATSA